MEKLISHPNTNSSSGDSHTVTGSFERDTSIARLLGESPSAFAWHERAGIAPGPSGPGSSQSSLIDQFEDFLQRSAAQDKICKDYQVDLSGQPSIYPASGHSIHCTRETGGKCGVQTEKTRTIFARESGSREPSEISIASLPIAFRSRLTPGSLPAGDRCGEIRSKVVCPSSEQHYTRRIPHSCKKPTCEICWPIWAARAAKGATDTINGYREASGTRYYAQHVILSPPQTTIPSGDPGEVLQWILDQGNQVATRMGITAAQVVPHPYRMREEKNEYCIERAREASRILNKKINKYEWALSQPDWFNYVYFSPHLHLLTFGFFRPSDEIEKETGWVYKNKGTRKDPTGTLYYLLTHAWVTGNHKIVRSWRGMSPRNLGSVKEKIIVYPVCPVCGEELVRVPWGDDPQDLANAARARRVEIHRKWFIRKHMTQLKIVEEELDDERPVPVFRWIESTGTRAPLSDAMKETLWWGNYFWEDFANRCARVCNVS